MNFIILYGPPAVGKLTTAIGIVIWHRRKGNFMQKIDKLIENFNESANEYDSITNTFHHNICNYIVEKNLFHELPKDNKNYKVLDSGGGTGYWAIKLAEIGFDITLTDISKNELEVAKQKI